MVSDKVFSTDGTQKIFSSDFAIISEDHLRVYLGASVVSRDDYDLINNAAVFNVAPTTGQVLTVQVGTTPADILVSPTDASIVAANIADINALEDILGDIVSVNTNNADVTTVATNIASVNTTATNIADVTAVAGISANVTTVAGNTSNINAVASDATDIGTVATNIANVNTVATNITDVSSVATNMAEVLNADTNAATATTQAGIATTKASEASASASSALTYKNAAETAKTAAEAAQIAAEASADNFDDTYLGAKASDPTLDNDGDALTAGDLYFNSVNNKLRIYSTTLGWMDAAITAGDFVVKTGDTMTGSLTAPDFIGPLNGAVQFTAKNDEGVAITKGQVVYIKGVSGEVATVGLADANDPTKMPAFGLVFADANNNAEVEIVTFGSLKDTKTDYTGWSLGDTLYVSTTAGALTNSAPTGEAASIQNIGKIQRVHAAAGIIKVGGAGRTNATPNLNDGNIFIGNASNQAVSVALSTVANLYTHPTGDGNLHVPANGTTNNGKYLQASATAGTYTWEAVDALPTQTGNAGKYLGTDGTTASWNTLDTDANSTTKGLYEHSHTISADYTIATGNNALTAGPITINTGVSVTVPTGSTWVVA